MDELLPPIIRDNKLFMYPFFYYAFKGYKGKDISTYMSFKSLAYDMSEEEFAEVYQNLESLGGDRPTDMNEGCMQHSLSLFNKSAKTFLDVGCGRGYWANRVHDETKLKVTGCDVLEHVDIKGAYVQGSMEKLPFKDNSFDIVFSSHTIEHIRNLPKAISELKRVAKKQVIIVTPCQRYYYYTLDLHLNFFPLESYMKQAVNDQGAICKKIGGDWVVAISC
jgi:ubiquinone/menaquinone biosynthesis C-methylase UbiE